MKQPAAVPFALGETYSGTDADSNLINNHLLGQVHLHQWINPTADAIRSANDRLSGKQVRAVILRNQVGAAVLPKRMVLLDATAGYDAIEAIDGYGDTLAMDRVVFVDPWLPSAGVADDDLFWGIIGGPTIVLTPAAGAAFNGDIAVGAPLVCATAATTGTSTAGRVSNVTLPGQTGATQAFSMANNCVGYALSARTTGETESDLLVDAICKF